MNSFLVVALALNWVLLIVIGVLIAGILRFLGSLQERIQQSVPHVTRFERGEAVSAFSLPDLAGRERPSAQLIGHDRPTLLFLLTNTCAECEVIARQLVELARRPGGLRQVGWDVVIAWYGDPRTVQARATTIADADGITVLVDEQGRLARAFLVSSLPVGLALDAQGKVLSQSANPGPNWLYRTLEVSAPSEPLQPAWIGEIQARA